MVSSIRKKANLDDYVNTSTSSLTKPATAMIRGFLVFPLRSSSDGSLRIQTSFPRSKEPFVSEDWISAVKAPPELAPNGDDGNQAVGCVDQVSSVRVLVVEDCLTFRQYIDSILGGTGDLKISREACDGLETIRKAEELQPSLILFDNRLATRDGAEAARPSEAAARKSSTNNEAPRELFGLPCTKCHAYYASSATECPVCHSTQRITPSNLTGAMPKTTL
jgi:hypothetical protein